MQKTANQCIAAYSVLFFINNLSAPNKEPPACIFLHYYSPYKIKTSCKSNSLQDVAFYCTIFSGERGIRTPGPPVSGQRFSRPPH